MREALKLKSKEIAGHSAVFDARNENDTIRLWENYRDQALMWRAIALFQIPATFVAVVLSLFMWVTRSVTLNVPARPLPGIYLAKEIPDVEFKEMATEYLNLIATYSPATARRQFTQAREMLKDTMLPVFDSEMMSTELQTIERTYRTQLYFIDPARISEPLREGNNVTVTVEGDRLKIIAGKELPVVKSRYRITMTTIPRNTLNPYGIVISNVTFENIERFGQE